MTSRKAFVAMLGDLVFFFRLSFDDGTVSFMLRNRKGSLSHRCLIGVENGERAYKTMANVDNDNTVITDAPGREPSPAESSLHDQGMPFASHFPRFWHREYTSLTRLSKFLAVGGIGVLVNSFALFVLFQLVHLPLVVASTLSTELVIVNNFFWNDRWTFGRPQLSLRRFARFNLVS